MAIKTREIKSEEQLKAVMNTVTDNFKSSSKDFLLTKIMYAAVNNNVPISKEGIRCYYKSCSDVVYKSVVNNLLAQKKSYARQSKAKKDNRLIALSDNKVYTLEEIIARQKGKLTLIDFWASWCMPCLAQQPYMEKLQQKFAGRPISFIYVSMDRRLPEWQRKNEEDGINPNYSYVFENAHESSFVTHHAIESIPRYILIDKDGTIINADAPTPDDSALENLIKEHL